jgi:hypothetical protein
VEGDEEGSAVVADADLLGKDVEEDGLGGLVEGALIVPPEAEGAAVDEGAEGLHEVVGEAEGVAPVAVLEAEGGVEAGGDDGAGDGGAEDGVAVVEEGVEAVALGVAAEAREVGLGRWGGAEGAGGVVVGRVILEMVGAFVVGGLDDPGGPVESGGVGLGAAGVAGADLAGQGEEAAAGGALGVEVVGLGEDLGADDLPPEAFAKGEGGGELVVEAPDDLGMVGEGEEEGDGEVVVAAEEDDGAVFGEAGEGAVGEGGGGVVDDDEADVLAGDGAEGVGPAAEDELAVAEGEMGALAGDLQGALDHGGLGSFAGWREGGIRSARPAVPRGIHSVTLSYRRGAALFPG